MGEKLRNARGIPDFRDICDIVGRDRAEEFRDQFRRKFQPPGSRAH